MDEIEILMRKYSRCFGCKILEKEVNEMDMNMKGIPKEIIIFSVNDLC